MNKLIVAILVIVGLFIAAPSIGQTNFYKKAERKLAEAQYAEAIELYQAAYKKENKSRKPDCLWKIAECYRYLKIKDKAILYYEKAILAKSEHAEEAKKYIEELKKK